MYDDNPTVQMLAAQYNSAADINLIMWLLEVSLVIFIFWPIIKMLLNMHFQTTDENEASK